MQEPSQANINVHFPSDSLSSTLFSSNNDQQYKLVEHNQVIDCSVKTQNEKNQAQDDNKINKKSVGQVVQCCEYYRQKTFFGNPLNQLYFYQNCPYESSQIDRKPNQNPQIHQQAAINIFELEEQKSINYLMHENHSQNRSYQNSTDLRSSIEDYLNDEDQDIEGDQKKTDTERLIEIFDKQEQEPQNKQSECLLRSVKQNKYEIDNETRQMKQQREEHWEVTTTRKSIVREIQQKIKMGNKSKEVKRTSKFSLEEFNLNKHNKKLILSSPIKNSQLIDLFQQVKTPKAQKLQKQQSQTERLLQLLTMTILPEFQKLKTDYTEKIEKINEKIDEITKVDDVHSYSFLNYKFMKERNSPLSNQSIIRINLNDSDDKSEQSETYRQAYHSIESIGKGSNLPKISEANNEDFDRSEQIGPTIKRTDSEDELYASVRSNDSNCNDIQFLKQRRNNSQFVKVNY